MAIGEVIFDIFYLVSVIIISFLILKKGKTKNDKAIIYFGMMGLLLGFGDAFHLVPRIIAHLTTGLEDYQPYLGFGKLITSITMTVFYGLIYLVYETRTGIKSNKMRIGIVILIIVRLAFIALPGNAWIANNGELFYGILRNIPFSLLGVLIIVLFLNISKKKEYFVFREFAVGIIVSFICYLLVVLFAGTISAFGAFMLPKTAAYLAVIYIGYRKL